MKKNHRSLIKFIIISFLVVIGIGTRLSLESSHSTGVEANLKPSSAEQLIKPGHHKAYKLGMANDIEMSHDNYNQVAEKNNLERQELVAKEQAEKEKEENERLAKIERVKQTEQVEASKQIEEQETSPETKEVAIAQSSSQSDSSHASQSTQNTANASQVTAPSPAVQPVQKTNSQQTAQTAPTPAPASQPQAPAIGSNKIGINGIYHSYTNYGNASTDQFQSGINAGLIVAGFTHFNGNDGETTYFGGHNPGIMRFMENNIYIGATVTVTDGNGQAHHYKMIDKVDVDEYGEGVLTSIGRSAIDAYMYGTGTESVLIQFCNTNNYLMSFWYGVKI